MGRRNRVLDEVQIPQWKGQFWRIETPIIKYRDFLPSADRFAVWVVDSSGPKDAQVQSYSPGGASVPL